MPWKESCAMTERMKFVGRLLDGERMSDLCLEYDISRKTGYKIFRRFQEEGIAGLEDQSKAARSHPNQTSKAAERAILAVRAEHPTWGAPKIKSYLERKAASLWFTRSSVIPVVYEIAALVTATGLRRGELYQLQPDCLDFESQFLTVKRSLPRQVKTTA